MKSKLITLMAAVVVVGLFAGCGTSRKATKVAHNDGIELRVEPQRNGGAPETLKLRITNNTRSVIQFGADYSIEYLSQGKWVEVDLGNFAVIMILYSLEPGANFVYDVNLFTDRVSYPEGKYRVVKRINVGEGDALPFYGEFEIIEPR